MHKYLISLIILTFSVSVFAVGKTWDSLNQSSTYELKKEIVLTDDVNTITLKPGMRFRLSERTSMGMIKVELYKFDISSQCTDTDMTTDIQLLDVIQSNGRSGNCWS
jgi:hypothetical protein